MSNNLKVIGSVDPAIEEYVEIAKAYYDESSALAWGDDSVLYVKEMVLGGRDVSYIYYLKEVSGRNIYRAWSITKIDHTQKKAVTYVQNTRGWEDLQDMAYSFVRQSEKTGISHVVIPLVDFEMTILRGNVALLSKDTLDFCGRKGQPLSGIIAF